MVRQQVRDKLVRIVWLMSAIVTTIAILTFCVKIVTWFPNRFDRLEAVITENCKGTHDAHSQLYRDFDQFRREIEIRRTIEEMRGWINRIYIRVEVCENKVKK